MIEINRSSRDITKNEALRVSSSSFHGIITADFKFLVALVHLSMRQKFTQHFYNLIRRAKNNSNCGATAGTYNFQHDGSILS